MIQLRLFDREKDYPVLEGWWRGHGWDAVPLVVLPPCGVVVYDVIDGVQTDLCAGWLYMTLGTGLSFMEWVVSNPEASVSGLRTARAITEMVKFLRARAAENDYGIMMTASNNNGLIRLYERAGFRTTDSKLTHLLMLTKEA